MRQYDPYNIQAVSYALDQLSKTQDEEIGLAIIWLAAKVNRRQTTEDPRVRGFMARISKHTLDNAVLHRPVVRVKMGKTVTQQLPLGFSSTATKN